MATPTFSQQDAEYLIVVSQRAPLANMKEAEHLSGLLQRFKAWYEHVANNEGAKKAPGRKGRQEVPASPPEDPAA